MTSYLLLRLEIHRHCQWKNWNYLPWCMKRCLKLFKVVIRCYHRQQGGSRNGMLDCLVGSVDARQREDRQLPAVLLLRSCSVIRLSAFLGRRQALGFWRLSTAEGSLLYILNSSLYFGSDFPRFRGFYNRLHIPLSNTPFSLQTAFQKAALPAG